MDHSPSEQLSNCPDDWHTTVVVLSEGGEHWHLASDLARRMGCKNETLKKWSGRRSAAYKSKFEETLIERAVAYPVHIRAISAQTKTIQSSFDHMVFELGLSNLVRRITSATRPKMEFGPFQRVRTLSAIHGTVESDVEPIYFQISERQGIHLVFICHFLIRIHQQFFALIQSYRPEVEWIDWQLMPNKFPNDLEGPMAKLFHAVMSGASLARLVIGNIRVVTLRDAKADHGNILTDNIAGLFSDKLESRRPEFEPIQSRPTHASTYWEVWNHQIGAVELLQS